MKDDEIIREFHESSLAYEQALDAAWNDTVNATSDTDRRVKARTRVHERQPELVERQVNAVVALEAVKAARDERWIAAHEDLASMRDYTQRQQ